MTIVICHKLDKNKPTKVHYYINEYGQAEKYLG